MNIPIEHLLNYAKISFQKEVVSSFKESLVIEKYATDHKMVIDPDELQEFSDMFFEEIGIKGEIEARQWLKKKNFRYDDYEQMLILNLFKTKVKNDVISEKDVQEYFQAHLFTFEKVRLYKIVMGVESQALSVAQKIKSHIIDFYYAARRYSEEPETAYAFGYAGTLKYAEMPYDFQQLILNAEDRTLMGPALYNGQYYLLRADEVVPPLLTEATFKDVQNILFSQWLKNEVKKLKDVHISGSSPV